jgi:hypothetical protein
MLTCDSVPQHVTPVHSHSVTPQVLAQLLEDAQTYTGSEVSLQATRLLPLRVVAQSARLKGALHAAQSWLPGLSVHLWVAVVKIAPALRSSIVFLSAVRQRPCNTPNTDVPCAGQESSDQRACILQ